jgi:hypothetical protein
MTTGRRIMNNNNNSNECQLKITRRKENHFVRRVAVPRDTSTVFALDSSDGRKIRHFFFRCLAWTQVLDFYSSSPSLPSSMLATSSRCARSRSRCRSTNTPNQRTRTKSRRRSTTNHLLFVGARESLGVSHRLNCLVVHLLRVFIVIECKFVEHKAEFRVHRLSANTPRSKQRTKNLEAVLDARVIGKRRLEGRVHVVYTRTHTHRSYTIAEHKLNQREEPFARERRNCNIFDRKLKKPRTVCN